MAAPTNTLLIEGSFDELIDELAQYIDSLKHGAGDESSSLQSDVANLLQDNKKEDALKKVVGSASVLNNAPEKAIIPAYNLLLHVVRQAPNPDMFFARICQHLSAPMTGSPQHGAGLALTLLSTMFNIIPPSNDARYHVFMAILKVVRSSSSFDSLRPQLKKLETWLEEWDMDEEEQRRLYMAVADVAKDTGEEEQAYQYLVRALRTVPAEESASEEARRLSLRALKEALDYPSHFDFQDLTSLDSIQALRKSDQVHFELLELFTSELLDDFNDFKDEHQGWLAQQGLKEEALDRKMRLLTLASISASAGQSRSLPYASIAKALQVPVDEVEMWVIDVIRAGLVEGKLSQLNQTFLIHRSTYRVFGENHWREVAARLDLWKRSLTTVLSGIREQKEVFGQAREQEIREMEAKLNGATSQGHRNRQPRVVEVDAE